MANPDKYVVSYSFGDYQSTNPNRPLPGPALDNELFEIATSLGETIDGLEDIRRSDGKLQNGIVTTESLAVDILLGMGAPTAWASGIDYAVNNTVFYQAKFYICNTAHLSGVSFDAAKWTLLADLSAGAATDSGLWFSAVDTVKTADYTILTGDAGKMLVANKATAINFTFSDASTLGTGVFLVRNVGVGALTLIAGAGQSIEGVANPAGLALPTGWAAIAWVSGSSIRAQLLPAPSDLVKGATGTTNGHFVSFGADGKTLTDSGKSASDLGSWSSLPEQVKTADYTITVADAGNALVANKATAIQFTLPTVATATGKSYMIRNVGAGLLTIDGSGSELIEGAAAITLKQGCAAIIWCNGGSWRAFTSLRVATTAEAQAGTTTGVYMDPATVTALLVAWSATNLGTVTHQAAITASTTWTKPAGLADSDIVRVQAWGGGGSGSGVVTGGGGGGGGAYETYDFLAVDVPSSVTVTIGAGGAGASQAAGGTTTFGSLLSAAGGGGGLNAGTGGAGGVSRTVFNGNGGAGGAGGVPGGNAVWGGGGGGGQFGAPLAGGTSTYGGAGGAGGTSASAADGTAPGGGGGTIKAGARGEVRVTIIKK